MTKISSSVVVLIHAIMAGGKMAPFGSFTLILPVLVLLFSLVTVIVHIAFAFAVLFDAGNRRQQARLQFVGPGIWFLATLLGGIVVVAVYWLMHHSTLNPPLTGKDGS